LVLPTGTLVLPTGTLVLPTGALGFVIGALGLLELGATVFVLPTGGLVSSGLWTGGVLVFELLVVDARVRLERLSGEGRADDWYDERLSGGSR
jgi:hypothetical protein